MTDQRSGDPPHTADVILRPSPIHGIGMFAARPFAAGERILRRNELRDVTPDAPLRPEHDEHEHHCDWLAGGRQILLGLPDRHFNHSCDPSAYVREIDGVRYIYARRDVAPGDEITNDYAMGGSGSDVWECNCNAASCRRLIHGDYFHLPLAKQAEYLPLQPQWFLRERRAEFDALRTRMRELGVSAPPPPGEPDTTHEATPRIIGASRELTEDTARRLIDTLDRTGALAPIRRIRSSQVVSAILGAVGLALFIVGVENAAADIPVLSNAYGSITAGLVLLAVTGALLARLRGH